MPNDQPETLADICARIRTIDESMMRDLDFMAVFLEFLPRDIEAAAKRERENTIYAGRDGEMTLDECIARCNNNSDDTPRGRDVAQIGGWLRELRERRRAPGNAAALREGLEQALAYCESDQKSGIAYSDNDVLVPMLRAALSVAARNCDRPECADVESAWATYCAETNRADCKGFARWLFAKAEGGDHA